MHFTRSEIREMRNTAKNILSRYYDTYPNAMDSIDYGEVAGNRVRSISVNFIKETKPEEEVRLFRSVVVREDGHKTYFIEGKIEDKPCFCAQIDF